MPGIQHHLIDPMLTPVRQWSSMLRSYRPAAARADGLAALSVAIVAIPQAMAYALIAGVHPVIGLYGLIIQLFIGAAFASSNHISTGPTNTASILVASVATRLLAPDAPAEAYLSLVAGLALVSGLIQLAFAAGRMGSLFRYVSHAVIVGFTAGAGILIIANQLPSFLGIATVKPADPWPGLPGMIQAMLPNLTQVNPYVILIGVASLAAIFLTRFITRHPIAPLLAVFVGGLIVLVLNRMGIRPPVIGALPTTMPRIDFVHIDWAQAQTIFAGALALALLAMLETVAIAKSIAMRSNERIVPSQEFFALGTMNVVASFFSCYPGSSSLARSTLNYMSGARTRLASMTTSILVLLALLAFGSLGQYLPRASLAAILFIIAASLINWRYLLRIRRASKSDMIVCLATLIATLVTYLEYAIFIGIFLNIALYLRRASHLHLAEMVRSPEGGPFIERPLHDRRGQQSAAFLQMEGDLFFGLADELQDRLTAVANSSARVVIMRLKRTHSIDSSVMDVLEKFVEQMQSKGGHVLLCGVRPELYTRLEAFGLAHHIGKDNIFLTLEGVFASAKQAIHRARILVGTSIDLEEDVTDDREDDWTYHI